MAVCATCRQPGIHPTDHQCPSPQYADIVFTRHRGQAITVDEAPARTRISLQALMDRYAYLHMPTPGTIVFADQVLYRITGYAHGALDLELVEDWRPAASEPRCAVCSTPVSQHEGRICERPSNPPAPVSSDPAAEYQARRERWQQTQGNGEPPRVVTRAEVKEEPGA